MTAWTLSSLRAHSPRIALPFIITIRLLGCLSLALLPSVASAQTVSPRIVEFDPSADHNTSVSGVAVVDGYELRFYSVGGTQPLHVIELGKPAPEADDEVADADDAIESGADSGSATPVVAQNEPAAAPSPELPKPILASYTPDSPVEHEISADAHEQGTPPPPQRLFAYASAGGMPSLPSFHAKPAPAPLPVYRDAEVVGAPEVDDDHAEEERRAGHRPNQPALRHRLDEIADVRQAGAEEQQAKIAVPERAERSRQIDRTSLQQRHYSTVTLLARLRG